MSRRSAIAVTASCVINFVLVVAGRGSLGQYFAVLLALLLAAISIGVGVVAYLVESLVVEPPTPGRFASRAVILGLVAGSTFASLPIGVIVGRSDIARAKRFCDGLRPALERHKQMTGRYPDSVFEITTRDQLPWLLRKGTFYRSTKDRYSFWFHNPMGVFEGVLSKGDSHAWRNTDIFSDVDP